jgi:3',5'-cyclic AMP phosphodiesterase CpdA
MTRLISTGAAALTLALLAACSPGEPDAPAPTTPTTPPVQTPEPPPAPVSTAVAFMSDVHFQDVYGDFKSSQFSGIPTKDGRNATIRTMYAQLTSTRLFNENYFAFYAALDDAYAKGIRYVALPGDYTDDAQPMNVDGIAAIMKQYQAKGMRFFLAPGNHDPVEPYDDNEAGKNDFLTKDGKEQKVYASGNAACVAKDPSVVCTDQIMEQGYDKLMSKMGEFGFMPNKADLLWETPFSKYTGGKYSYDEAVAQAATNKRQFEICAEGSGGAYKAAGEAKLGKAFTKCVNMIDSTYLVEPVKGLWLLSIDANVFVPNAKFDPAKPNDFKGYDGAGNAGWNKVITHKMFLMDYIKSVAARAKLEGKQLMAFSHYPTMDFYANQTDAMKAVFKSGAFQTARVPDASVANAVAATGLRLHVGGHMHFNGTNDHQDTGGNYLVNVQSPSLAVYGAAYKIVTYKDAETIDVQTMPLNTVPRFAELFPLYVVENDYLKGSSIPADAGKRWDRAILDTRSYGEYTRYYFGELSRLRFMDEYWPCEMKEAAMNLNAKQMLILSQLQTKVTLAQLKDAPGIVPLTASCAAAGTAAGMPVTASTLSTDWADATARADKLASAAGLRLDDFAALTAYEFYGDFHRTVYAGELALRDMGQQRVSQYKVLMSAFPASPAAPVRIADKLSDQNPVGVAFQHQFKQVFAILKGLGSAKPSDHFTVDLKGKKVSNASNNGLSFN